MTSDTRATAPRFAAALRLQALKGTYREDFGRSRGGFTTKIHSRADGQRRLLCFVLTRNEASDYKAAPHSLARPVSKPRLFLADKAMTVISCARNSWSMLLDQSFRRQQTERTRLPATFEPARIETASNGCSIGSTSSAASPHATMSLHRINPLRRDHDLDGVNVNRP